jgi:hypothetical protein
MKVLHGVDSGFESAIDPGSAAADNGLCQELKLTGSLSFSSVIYLPRQRRRKGAHVLNSMFSPTISPTTVLGYSACPRLQTRPRRAS